MKNNKAVTLLELIVVIIILGILATIPLTNHNRTIEKSIGRDGEFQVQLLYNAQKRFRLNNGFYYGCGGSCNVQDINRNLEVLINQKHFSFDIQNNTLGTTFEIIANRIGGNICNGRTIVVTSASNVVVNNCPGAWLTDN